MDEDKELFKIDFPTDFNSEKSISKEYRIKQKNGTVRWVETNITSSLNKQGDLLRIDPSISTDTLINAIENQKVKVEEYSAATMSYMNPYTIIRHCIYLSDKVKYRTLLYEVQRNAYEHWTK